MVFGGAVLRITQTTLGAISAALWALLPLPFSRTSLL